MLVNSCPQFFGKEIGLMTILALSFAELTTTSKNGANITIVRRIPTISAIVVLIFLCFHYISTSFFLLIVTCVRDTIARIIKNITALV